VFPGSHLGWPGCCSSTPGRLLAFDQIKGAGGLGAVLVSLRRRQPPPEPPPRLLGEPLVSPKFEEDGEFG